MHNATRAIVEVFGEEFLEEGQANGPMLFVIEQALPTSGLYAVTYQDEDGDKFVEECGKLMAGTMSNLSISGFDITRFVTTDRLVGLLVADPIQGGGDFTVRQIA